MIHFLGFHPFYSIKLLPGYPPREDLGLASNNEDLLQFFRPQRNHHNINKIAVELYQEGEMVGVKVADNGIGIPDDKKEKVFVPNFTTKSSGTGLGLAISKNIVESVSGEIFFNTEVDKGTDFHVRLPIIKAGKLEEAVDESTY